MRVQNVKLKTNFNPDFNKNDSSFIQFTGGQKVTRESVQGLKKLSPIKKIGIEIKKLLEIFNVNTKGFYNIRVPFFKPNNVISEKGIELGKFCHMGKLDSYIAPIIKSYGKLSGNVNGMDTWIYPGSKVTKTAQIMTDIISIRLYFGV